MASSFSGSFTEIILRYSVSGNEATEDDFGNVTQGTTEATVKAYLKSPKTQRQALVGADVVLVAYEGRLTEPSVPPANLVTGTVVSFEMDGRTQTGALVVLAPSPIPGLDSELGRKIEIAARG